MRDSRGSGLEAGRRGFAWWACLTALVALGLGLRLPELGRLSFYGDEETTALAARSVAEDGAARMPSGMEYRRALPYTWLAAGLASRMGTDREAPYRLLPAILGGLTPAALFVAGTAFVGPPAAFVAGVLLAASEWHVAFSRIARMYAPFAFFYVLSAWCLWRWGRGAGRKYAWLAAGAVAAALSLHPLGLVVLLFAVLPLAFRGAAAVPAGRLLGFAAIGGAAGVAYERLFVSAPYRAWGEPAVAAVGGADLPPALPTVGAPFYPGLVVVASLVFCLHILRRIPRGKGERAAADLPAIVLALAAAAAIGLALLGQIIGAASAAAVGLIAGGGEFVRLLRRERRWFLIATAVAAGWLVVMVATRGPLEGLKSVAYFPYPYAGQLFLEYPIIVLLAAWATIVAVLGGRHAVATVSGERKAVLAPCGGRDAVVPVRAVALSVLVPVLAIGTVSRWGPPRYFFHLYPFLLLLSAVGLVGLAGWLLARTGLRGARLQAAAIVGAAVLACSGLLDSHGLPDAVRVIALQHGEPTDPGVHMTPFRPDHATPGRYVRDHADETDVIVAVDVLEQAWYVGRADYWLRSETDASLYIFADESGAVREFYVASRLLRSREELDRIVAEAGERRVWLTTSGEVSPDDAYTFSAWQRTLLERLGAGEEGREMFVGRDGVTTVYCLNCPPGSQADPRSGARTPEPQVGPAGPGAAMPGQALRRATDSDSSTRSRSLDSPSPSPRRSRAAGDDPEPSTASRSSR